MQEFRAEDPDLGSLVEWLTDGQTPSADVLREQAKLGQETIVHGSHARGCFRVRQGKGTCPLCEVVRKN